MSSYQGRALDRTPRSERGSSGAPGGLVTKVVRILVVMLVLFGLAMVPWGGLRHRYAVLTDIEVTGLRYLDAARIERQAGLHRGQDLLALDLQRVRQMVLLDPRVRDAQVSHRGLRGVSIAVTERAPALVVLHGEPWEMDSSGVLLEPLQPGVVADVPMLSGVDLSGCRPGSQVGTTAVQRGLAWAAVLGDNALRLSGQVSEVDVSEPRTTRIVLLDGTRVIGPAMPVDMRQLSGLRTTLADLAHKGMTSSEVDVRFPEQIIVRDARPVAIAAGPPHTS